MILRCTKKLLTAIGSQRVVRPAPERGPEDWYANLLWFNRRKCLLLTHSATLFTVFEPSVSVADLRATNVLVTRMIHGALGAEGLPTNTFDLGEEECVLTTTADRQVLGCMNDLALHCEIAIVRSGGLDNADCADLNRRLRRTIFSARDYRQPLKLVAERYSR
jgi:hypothetical protein